MSGAAAICAGEPVLLGAGVVGGFGLAVPTGEVSPTTGSGGVMVASGAGGGAGAGSVLAAAFFLAARLRGAAFFGRRLLGRPGGRRRGSAHPTGTGLGLGPRPAAVLGVDRAAGGSGRSPPVVAGRRRPRRRRRRCLDLTGLGRRRPRRPAARPRPRPGRLGRRCEGAGRTSAGAGGGGGGGGRRGRRRRRIVQLEESFVRHGVVLRQRGAASGSDPRTRSVRSWSRRTASRRLTLDQRLRVQRTLEEGAKAYAHAGTRVNTAASGDAEVDGVQAHQIDRGEHRLERPRSARRSRWPGRTATLPLGWRVSSMPSGIGTVARRRPGCAAPGVRAAGHVDGAPGPPARAPRPPPASPTPSTIGRAGASSSVATTRRSSSTSSHPPSPAFDRRHRLALDHRDGDGARPGAIDRGVEHPRLAAHAGRGAPRGRARAAAMPGAMPDAVTHVVGLGALGAGDRDRRPRRARPSG